MSACSHTARGTDAAALPHACLHRELITGPEYAQALKKKARLEKKDTIVGIALAHGVRLEEARVMMAQPEMAELRKELQARSRGAPPSSAHGWGSL
jgi:hypothetical protein